MSEKEARVFQWLDKNGDSTSSRDLIIQETEYEMNTVRDYQGRWRKKKAIEWIIKRLKTHRELEPGDDLILAKETGIPIRTAKLNIRGWENDTTSRTEIDPNMVLNSTTARNIKADRIGRIKTAEPTAHVLTDFEISILKKVITEYVEKKDLNNPNEPLFYKITGETKPVNYFFEKKLDEDFTRVCRKVGLKKKEALHIAVKTFVDRYF